MKTVRIYQTGEPEVMNYEDAPEPSPAPGQALVEIKSIGVNYTDVSSRKGTNPPDSFPWTPGREAAGVVTAIGDGVTEVSVGDRVAYAMHTGTYSQVHSVPSWLLVKIPDGMDFATAAATMLQGMTAHFLVYGIAHVEHRRPRAGTRRGRRHGPLAHPDAQEHRRLRPHYRLHRREGRAGKGRRRRPHHHLHQAGFRGGGPQGRQRPGTQDGHGRRRRHHLRPGHAPPRSPWLHGALRCRPAVPVGQIDSGVLRGGSLFLTRPSLGDYTATRDELLQRADDVLRWVQSGEVKLYVGLELSTVRGPRSPPTHGRPRDHRQNSPDAITRVTRKAWQVSQQGP